MMFLVMVDNRDNFVNKEFSYYKVPMELDVFDQDAFAESGVPFYVVATDIKTGKPDYIKIDHVFEQMEALRASSGTTSGF